MSAQAYEPRTLSALWCWTEAAQNLWWHYLLAIMNAAFGKILVTLKGTLKQRISESKAPEDSQPAVRSGHINLVMQSDCL